MFTIKKGLDLPIEGLPEQKVTDAVSVPSVAVLGQDYIGMKPSMVVQVGDSVKLGQLLFTDKKMPSVRYTSPAAGVVSAIHRGEKRKLLSVVIDVDEEKENTADGCESFESYTEEEIKELSFDLVKDGLVQSGLWTALRTRPFSKVPDPNSKPSSIFVTAIDTNPLAGKPELVISKYPEWFDLGIRILSKLTDGCVHICSGPNVRIPLGNGRQSMFDGPHPAGLAGTHIHFLDPVSTNKTVWVIGYQDVIAIGHLFNIGRLMTSRIIALGGPQVKLPRLLETRLGAALSSLLDGELFEGENRVISGSVFSGHTTCEFTGFLGRYHNMVTVLKEGRERPFLHYLHLGRNRHSVMPVYISKLKKKLFFFTTSTNGSPRAMVPVGSYEKVMPLDILPTQLLRALIVGDTEMAQKLGALELDEEDLSLCTYVCPSKYEYGPILRDNLNRIEKEG